MKFIYLALFVSTLAAAGDHRVVSCKSPYQGKAAEFETDDNGNKVASSKLVLKLAGVFNLPKIGFLQQAVLEVPRTQCDFDAQDSALVRCTHVFGPGATLKAKTETGDVAVDLQHVRLETRRVTGVGEKKLDLRLLFFARPHTGAHRIDMEFFEKECTATN